MWAHVEPIAKAPRPTQPSRRPSSPARDGTSPSLPPPSVCAASASRLADICLSRLRKVKCTGEKPACSGCETKGLSCKYDTVVKRRGPDKLRGGESVSPVFSDRRVLGRIADAPAQADSATRARLSSIVWFTTMSQSPLTVVLWSLVQSLRPTIKLPPIIGTVNSLSHSHSHPLIP
jgi:hypothetical protein